MFENKADDKNAICSHINIPKLPLLQSMKLEAGQLLLARSFFNLRQPEVVPATMVVLLSSRCHHVFLCKVRFQRRTVSDKHTLLLYA